MSIRLLVVNDSATSRAAIRMALGDEPDLEVVGELPSAVSVAEMVQSLAPDVVLMDIVMPEIDGFEATRQILLRMRVPVLMISAAVSARDVAVAMEALRAGAIAVLETPPPPGSPDYELSRRALIHTIRSAAALPRRTVDRLATPPRAERAVVRDEKPTFEVVGLVASLGGPPVVAEILGALKPEHPPVLLVQHIEPSFVGGFVEWLRGATRRNVRVAVAGEDIARDTIYMAPPDHHLVVASDGRIHTTVTAPVSGFRPSGSVLLASLARTYGRRALGVVLTGMGQDGADGALQLRNARGFVIAQDEASCAVAAMPNAARARGAVDISLPPASIPAYLR